MAQDLFAIKRHYGCLYPPQKIRVPSGLSHSTLQTFLLSEILHDDHLNAYAPAVEYQRTFWKRMLSHLETASPASEDEEFEVASEIYEHYLGLLHVANGPQPMIGGKPPSKSFITYFWQDSASQLRRATLLESRNTIEGGTTGLRTWTASFALAQYLVDHPDLVAGQRVLELGSGIGFLGIVLSAIQAHNTETGRLWMTDVDETVLASCQANINLPCNVHLGQNEIHTRRLDWHDALDEARLPGLHLLLRHDINPDVIVGADIVFDPSLIQPLLAILGLALGAKRATFALLALTLRNEQTMATFLNAAKAKGLVVEDLTEGAAFVSVSFLPSPSIDGNLRDVKLFRFTLPVPPE
ncbi:putative methyltransferase-domain-containing protein [Coprinopsis sp. MPI-PUGE-AT-0042]|nr:putative methyltransferase-domain-containing protein [Coprinopsis sp. MPI-PUGE-AT-0042]